jgi:UDP-N-acetylmuramate--alanine ligase
LKVHLMGAGGTGVSSLALLLAARGEQVTGCDARRSETTELLEKAGIPVALGHDPGHVRGIDLLVRTAAVPFDAPEPAAARAAGVRSISRAELLADLIAAGDAIAVAGTHGKTTTTLMLGQVLAAAGFDPAVLVGDGRSTRTGGGRWLVAEADESDGSLALHHPRYAIVTNLELDHPDFFADLAAVRDVFERFAGQVSDLAVVCADDAEVMGLRFGCRRVSYGLDTADHTPTKLGLRLQVPGRHNLLNATAAAAMAIELGVQPAVALESLAAFTGAHRRLELVGEWRGARLYDDYGHHPTEVRATLEAARELHPRRLLLVFQPHRYTRLAGLLDQFAGSFGGADEVIITEVYSAGEEPSGVGGRQLAEKVPGSRFAPHFDTVKDDLYSLVEPGDLVLFMGAGDIWKIPHELAE